MSASLSIWLLSLAVGFPQDGAGTADVIAPGATLEKVWGEGSFTEGGAAGPGRLDPVFRHRQPDHAV